MNKKSAIHNRSDAIEPIEIKEIPIPLGAKHPPVPHNVLPQHEFSIGLVAPKGAGKTTLMCNIIKNYAGYFHSIIIFSPSVKNDEKWDWVRKQKLLTENTRLLDWIREMKEQQMRDQNTIVQRPPGVDIIKGLVDMNLLAGGKQRKRDYDGKFDGRIPEGCFHYEYSEETLKDILTQQQLMVDFLKKHDKTKHWANRILILFDDLVGSSLFSNARQNTFKMLNTNHRHLSTSLIMVSQAFKEIPKTVRTQFSALVLFEIYSDGEIEAIYNEFPMGMKKDTWLEAYRYCVADEYAFMYYNIQREKALRVMKKFQQVLSVQEDPNIPEPKGRKTK